MKNKPKLIRVTTVPISMNILLKGQLSFMNEFFNVIGVTGYDEKHYNEVKEREGISLHRVEMKRTISLLHDLKALWKLYILFRREKPQIVHTHTPKAGLLGMLASKMAKVPIRLHTVAGMPLTEVKGLKRIILNTTERITYFSAHKIYPNSVGLKDIILENKFCRREKLEVLANGSSNGIDTEYFTRNFVKDQDLFKSNLRKELGIRNEDNVFCFVGRLCIEKGIAELVNSFLKLLNTYPDKKMKLLLVGPLEKQNGALSGATMDIINNTKEILAVGRHDDIRPYLFISDIFVFPSYREGFPNVVLQAGAMGLPCIVSDINGCNEIIEDGKNGIVVTPKDEENLFNSMELLLNNDVTKKKFSKDIRKDIVEKYQREIVWHALRNTYNKRLRTTEQK